MKDKKYHIVKRNNYFLGKLMTVRDFFTEQNYFNSRRRLGNMFLSGPGIVAGLNIFLVDDKTFSLEPGFAIDYYGREIIVNSSCVRKFNLIRGFEEHKNKSVIYLCLKYHEFLDESTFSITSSGNAESEKQYNRISESYELFITDKSPDDLSLTVESFMFQKVSIYDLNGVHIWGVFPKFFNPGKKSKIRIFFEKEKLDDFISFNFKVSGILFKNSSEISYKQVDASEKNFGVIESFIECDASDETETELIISRHDFELKVADLKYELNDEIKINISIKNDSLKNLMISSYYSMNFDSLIEDNDDKFKVIVDGANYYVSEFKKHPADQYLLNNRLLELYQNLESYNRFEKVNNKGTSKREEIKEETETPVQTLIEKDNVSTGVEVINLGFKPKINSVYYSYEFEHGLGLGHVAIITSIVNEENVDLKESEYLIFGDRSIFESDEIHLSSPIVKCASIVDPKKGTMRIGVRVLERVNAQFVKVRWWAIKPLEKNRPEDLIIDSEMKIEITPDNVSIRPLEQVKFSAKVLGTQDQRIKWELGKDNPGKIDANGVYTAPVSEGVFEVIARSASFEEIHSSAYIVVSIAEG